MKRAWRSKVVTGANVYEIGLWGNQGGQQRRDQIGSLKMRMQPSLQHNELHGLFSPAAMNECRSGRATDTSQNSNSRVHLVDRL